METSEIANAHLSRAGNTTKHMSRAQRTDELTDQIQFWNVQRSERLATELEERHRRVQAQAEDLKAELEVLWLASPSSRTHCPSTSRNFACWQVLSGEV